MKKLALMAMIAMSVVACNSMDGQLTVQSSITLEKKTGLFGGGRDDVTIREGRYEATVNPTSSKNVNLELKVDGKKVKIPFSIAEGRSLPGHSGQVLIPSSESGQPYDLSVRSATQVSESGTYSRHESCVLGYNRVQRCRIVDGGQSCRNVPNQTCRRAPNGQVTCRDNGTYRRVCNDLPDRRECSYVDEPVYGSRQNYYVTVTEHKTVTAGLLEGSAQLASFVHRDSSSYERSVSSSACY